MCSKKIPSVLINVEFLECSDSPGENGVLKSSTLCWHPGLVAIETP